MDKKPAFLDLHRDDDSDDSISDQASQTDYTLIASCILPDESDKAKNQEIRAEQVREYIATEKNRHLSIKQKFLNFLGLM